MEPKPFSPTEVEITEARCSHHVGRSLDRTSSRSSLEHLSPKNPAPRLGFGRVSPQNRGLAGVRLGCWGWEQVRGLLDSGF